MAWNLPKLPLLLEACSLKLEARTGVSYARFPECWPDRFPQGLPNAFSCDREPRPTPEAAGYQRLDERDSWATVPGGRYYVTRNDSSIIAIKLGKQSPLLGGIRMVGAHTDSPCLRVKPQPELQRHGFLQLGVEVYGGALLAPWFDRDLSLAGRVTFRRDGKVESQLVDFKLPIAVIPNLAIHLNRTANEGWAINPQLELPPSWPRWPVTSAWTSGPCSPSNWPASTTSMPTWCWITS